MSRTHWTESDNPDRVGANILLRGIVVMALLTALSWGSYLAYLHFVEGPAITQHGQNMRAESMIPDYDAAIVSGDTTHMNSLRNAICSAALSINPDERDTDVRGFTSLHCGAH
jgi:hypothetical protein